MTSVKHQYKADAPKEEQKIMLKILNFEKEGFSFPRFSLPYLDIIKYTTNTTATNVPAKIIAPRFVNIQLNNAFVTLVDPTGSIITRIAMTATTQVLMTVNGILILEDFILYLPFAIL